MSQQYDNGFMYNHIIRILINTVSSISRYLPIFATVLSLSISVFFPSHTYAVTDSLVKKTLAPIWNGPFGLEKGLSLKTIQAHYQTATFIIKQPHTYWLPNPPKKSNAFPMITVTATPKAGVCAVSGNRVEKSDSTQIVRTIIQIVSDLSAKYGQPIEQSSGRALWTLNKTLTPLQSILVASDQISEDITLISVIYRFDNYEQCRSEWQKNSENTPKTSQKKAGEKKKNKSN